MPEPLVFPPPAGPPVTAADCPVCRSITDFGEATYLGVAYTADELHAVTVDTMMNPDAIHHLSVLRVLQWLAAAGRLTPLPIVRSLRRPDGALRVVVPVTHTPLDECRTVGPGPHGDWCAQVLAEASPDARRAVPPFDGPGPWGGGAAAGDPAGGSEPAQTGSAGFTTPGVDPAAVIRQARADDRPPDDRPPIVLDDVERYERNRRDLWPTDQSG
jgi:hypothetical protein